LSELSNRFIDPEDYTYDLPQDRIALFPLEERDHSKLLFYNQGKISHHVFSNISELLPSGSLLVFNNSRVIPARLHFRKSTGALIEILLLNPVTPSPLLTVALRARNTSIWKCMIGNLKKWHDDIPLIMNLFHNGKEFELQARIADRENDLIALNWNESSLTLAEIIALAGKIPLPPYINREPVEEDKTRYQTVYSEIDGAVASSTAGLHFTKEILGDLRRKNYPLDFITLHVGAGTFQPIKSRNAFEHDMHSEQVIITGENLKNIINHEGPVIAVGTTSLRTLESLYWYGVKLIHRKETEFIIEKLEPYSYEEKNLPALNESISAIRHYMATEGLNSLTGETGIYILPGYTFRICKGLITNYHLPGSTLLLLIAAFAGNDWKRIYTEALMNDYRFLSYGDSSLIIP
jgi:S-adenosylmethionine:tRNA ribosyltransferase-isomerase